MQMQIAGSAFDKALGIEQDFIGKLPIGLEQDVIVAVQPGIETVSKHLGIIDFHEARLDEMLAKGSHNTRVSAPRDALTFQQRRGGVEHGIVGPRDGDSIEALLKVAPAQSL